MPNMLSTSRRTFTPTKPVPSEPSPSQFKTYRKNITYTLPISNDEIVKYSIGGYIIGQRGVKIQSFTNSINNEHAHTGLK